jgi:DNA-binding HxlR family transcriptional regulator
MDLSASKSVYRTSKIEGFNIWPNTHFEQRRPDFYGGCNSQNADNLRALKVNYRSWPGRLILDHLADKWAVLIVVRLASGALRFAELRRALDGISQKMLTATLRDLERDGLVMRKRYVSVPPKVEYSLTSLGSSLVDKVNQLSAWAEANSDEIFKARERFDQRNDTSKL